MKWNTASNIGIVLVFVYWFEQDGGWFALTGALLWAVITGIELHRDFGVRIER